MTTTRMSTASPPATAAMMMTVWDTPPVFPFPIPPPSITKLKIIVYTVYRQLIRQYHFIYLIVLSQQFSNTYKSNVAYTHN